MGCVYAQFRYVIPSGIEKSRFAGSAAARFVEFVARGSRGERTPRVAFNAAIPPNPAKTSRRLMFIGLPPREKKICRRELLCARVHQPQFAHPGTKTIMTVYPPD